MGGTNIYMTKKRTFYNTTACKNVVYVCCMHVNLWMRHNLFYRAVQWIYVKSHVLRFYSNFFFRLHSLLTVWHKIYSFGGTNLSNLNQHIYDIISLNSKYTKNQVKIIGFNFDKCWLDRKFVCFFFVILCSN